MSHEASIALRDYFIVDEYDGIESSDDTYNLIQPIEFSDFFIDYLIADSKVGVVQATAGTITLQQALNELASATTLEEVEKIAASLSAAATGPSGAVLYSGKIGSAASEDIAVSIAKANNLNIINNTVRAQFLTYTENGVPVVQQKLAAIFLGLYPEASVAQIQKLVGQELFAGNSSSLWGQASVAFVQSIKGAVTIVATDADPTRILGGVEIPQIILNKSITSINDIAIAEISKTPSALAATIESSFKSALDAGGAFATAATETTGQLVASQTLAKLGLSTKGAKTAAQYLAEGLLDSSAPALETAAATTAETILASAGVKALGWFGNVLKFAGSKIFGVIVGVLDDSKPLNQPEVDAELAQQNPEWLAQDTAAANQTSLVTTDSNGTSVVNVPLINSTGTYHGQFILAENPTTDSVILAVTSNNDSSLTISSNINGTQEADDQITDVLPGNAYKNQITLTPTGTGSINVGIAIDQGGDAVVAADTNLSNVSQDFTFLGSSGTLQIDDPASFTGAIFGFVPGDTIDLAGIGAATSAILGANNVDTVQEAGGGTVTLNLDPTAQYSGYNTLVGSDGNGGTDITLERNVPPVTTVPGPLTVDPEISTTILGISVADSDATIANKKITVELSDKSGVLGAESSGDVVISGSGTNNITLTGSLDNINTELETLTYTGSINADTDIINVVTSDGRNGSNHRDILLTINSKMLLPVEPIQPKSGGSTVYSDGSPIIIDLGTYYTGLLGGFDIPNGIIYIDRSPFTIALSALDGEVFNPTEIPQIISEDGGGITSLYDMQLMPGVLYFYSPPASDADPVTYDETEVYIAFIAEEKNIKLISYTFDDEISTYAYEASEGEPFSTYEYKFSNKNGLIVATFFDADGATYYSYANASSVESFDSFRAALDIIPGGFVVTDTAKNVQADLTKLAADAHITTIAPTSGSLTEMVAEFATDQAALDKVVGGFAISDTAKNVQADLANLEADKHITTIRSTNPDGSFQIAHVAVTGQAYTSYTVQYGANGKPTSAAFSDGETATWSYNLDGSYDIAYFDVQGLGYSSYKNLFNSAGTRVADAMDMTSSSGSLLLYGDGLTISESSGQQSVTTGADTLAINPHQVETISASGWNDETFEFASGFGQDVITGLLATGATHDLLQFDVSMFSSLTSKMTQAQDVAALLAGATQSAAGLVITDSTGDGLILNAITAKTLSANPSDFKFV